MDSRDAEPGLCTQSAPCLCSVSQRLLVSQIKFFMGCSAEHSGSTAQEQETDAGSCQTQPKPRNGIQRVQMDPHPITLGQ